MKDADSLTNPNQSPPPKRFWPQDVVLGLLPLLVGIQIFLATFYVPQAIKGLDDFRQLYAGGYMIRTGHARELYNNEAQQHFQEELAPIGGAYVFYITHPAFEELLFVPLSVFPYQTAYWIFMAFNAALLILSAWLLRSHLGARPGEWKWLVPALIVAFFPISRTLEKGQDSIVMLALLTAALGALDQKREFMAGALVGIGIFKFQVAIPIALLFLAWRFWRFVWGFAAFSAAAALVSLWMVGLTGAKEYLKLLLGMSLRLAPGADMVRYGIDPREMLNLRGLLNALFVQIASHRQIDFLVAIASIAVLAEAARARPSLPLAIAAASLVSYHFIVHDASILLIVIAVALCSGSAKKGAVAAVLLILPLCAVVPPTGFLIAFPLVAIFFLMLRTEPGISGLEFSGSPEQISVGAPCR